MLGFEILAIRWISILFYPLASYVVIALALLGLGLSGAVLTLRGDRPPLLRATGRFAAAFAATSLMALALAWKADASPWWTLGLAVGLALPFFFAGLTLSTLFAAGPTRVSHVYFADLAGAGLGGVAVMIALTSIDGAALGLLLAAIGFGSAWMLSPERNWRVASLAAAGLLSVLALAAPLPRGMIPVAPKELGRALRLVPSAVWEWSKWNPLARIDVISFGPDPLEPDLPLDYRLVTQDGGAPSLLIRPDPSLGRLRDRTIFGIPFWIKPDPNVLIIGLGGGPDLLAALESNPRRVDVVEVNPAMIELVAERYRDFVGNPLADPRVRLTDGDGRFYIARSQDTYDLIQLTGVDTAVASASGSPNLAENYLYTREAFGLYLSHLEPDGILAVSFPAVEGLGLRLVNLVSLTLADIGVDRPQDHVVVADVTGYVLVVTKRSPFTAEEIDILEHGFERRISSIYFPLYHRLWGDPPQAFFARSALIASPRIEWPGVYGAYLDALSRGQQEEFLRSQPQTVEAPVDDRPFIFVLDKWGERAPNYRVLTGLLAGLAALGAVLLLGPPAILQRRGLSFGGRVPLGLSFLAIGLGYILMEVTLIQKLALFLGTPAVALAVTIGGLLIASAFGSLTSGRWKGSPQTLVAVAAASVAGLALLMSPLLAWVSTRFLGQPFPIRLLIALVLLAVPGFFMGVPFPTGLAYVKSVRPAFVPWAWGLNAAASVSATILALLIALHWGLNAVFLTTAVAYGGAALTFLLAVAQAGEGSSTLLQRASPNRLNT